MSLGSIGPASAQIIPQTVAANSSSTRGMNGQATVQENQNVQSQVVRFALDTAAEKARTSTSGIDTTPTYNVQARVETTPQDGSTGALINRTA